MDFGPLIVFVTSLLVGEGVGMILSYVPQVNG